MNHFRVLICLSVSTLFLSACGPTFPEKTITSSVQKLFKESLDVPVLTQLVGKTLYVRFPIENLVSVHAELPEDIIEKLEKAVFLITRIAFSTDANIRFTVIEARDETWGVQANVLRRVEDVKLFQYFMISKKDFDERAVFETKKVESELRNWHDITLPEFMGRLIASRMTLGARSNLILSAVLGLEKVSSQYDERHQTMSFLVESSGQEIASSTSNLTTTLLKNSILEQMALVEKKYASKLPEGEFWAERAIIKYKRSKQISEIRRDEWIHFKNRGEK